MNPSVIANGIRKLSDIPDTNGMTETKKYRFDVYFIRFSPCTEYRIPTYLSSHHN